MAEEPNMYESVVNWAIPQLKGKLNVSEQVFRDYEETFGSLYEKLPKQVIHRDPNPSKQLLCLKT